MKRERLVLTMIMALFLTMASIAAASPGENWVRDPNTGSRICIILSEGLTLVSAKWSGTAVNGKAEGNGRLTYITKDGKAEVSTIQADAEMKAGKIDGKVSIKYSNGETYNGNYKEGSREGKGVFVFKSGYTYDGEWKAGRPDGKGVANDPSGRTYNGEWKAGSPDGKGISKEITGMIYDGEWKNGMPHGKAVVKWPDGSTYEGDYKQGQRDGYGVMKDAKGKVIYSGEWKNDKEANAAD